jgi:[NiFe] hydrogenase assembly HybE family chaperone
MLIEVMAMQMQLDKLTQRFMQIDREHMQGLPFYNQNLQVEAVGFEENEQAYIGALITPWFINLMLIFKQQPQQNVVVGQKVKHKLPSGEYDFMVGEDAALGRYDFISLASPVGSYKNQQQAQAFALQKVRHYLAAAGAEEVNEHPLVFVDNKIRAVSRRSFLSGKA